MKRFLKVCIVLNLIFCLGLYFNSPILAAKEKNKPTDKKEQTTKSETSKTSEETKDSEDEEADDEDVEDEEETDSKQEAVVELKNYDIFLEDVLSETIYPSFILYTMMDKNLRNENTLFFYVEDEKAHVKLTIKENDLMDEAVFEHDMTPEDEKIFGVPIKWKRQGLLKTEQPGFVNISIIGEVNGVVKNRFNNTIDYRSVNEAVLGIIDDDGYNDFSPLFACYVNENNPNVDKVLSKILKSADGEGFYGYQGEKEEDVKAQLKMVWDYFAEKGTHYSDISVSTNNSEKVFTQTVRSFDKCIENNQANCIDGSCMLASIFRKIGLDVSLVFIPGHAFLHVAGKERDKDNNPVVDYFIETTMMGSGSFDEALEEGAREIEENNKTNPDDTFIVNIQSCRDLGIMPLGL